VYDTSAVVADGWKVVREPGGGRESQHSWVLEAVSDKSAGSGASSLMFTVTYYDGDELELFSTTAFGNPPRVAAGGRTKVTVDVPWSALGTKVKKAVVRPRRD
jgi:hypothetical protein